jgi:type VI secretion system secreted protein VgrG
LMSMSPLAKLNITHTANKISIKAVEEVEIVAGTSFTKWNAGGIEHGSNGVWRQQAASHSVSGPANAPGPTIASLDVALKETPPEHQIAFAMQAVPGLSSALLANQPFTLLKNGGEVRKGMFDEHGRLTVEKVEKGERYQVKLFNGTVHDLPIAPERMQSDPEHPEFHEHQLSNKGVRADGLTAEQRLAQSERGAATE